MILARLGTLSAFRLPPKANSIDTAEKQVSPPVFPGFPTVFMPNMDPEESADELIRDWPLHDRPTLVATLKRSVYYSPMMRFVLLDEKTREYQAERWCSLGKTDDWIQIGSTGPLSKLARQFCRHLGKESFFELM